MLLIFIFIFIVDKINDTVPYTYNMSYYRPYKSSSNNIKVELDLTNYATKNDLKNITHVDVSSFAS